MFGATSAHGEAGMRATRQHIGIELAGNKRPDGATTLPFSLRDGDCVGRDSLHFTRARPRTRTSAKHRRRPATAELAEKRKQSKYAGDVPTVGL